MDTEGVIQLLILLVLLILSAFYSAAETALTTVSEIKLNTLAEAGDKKAKRVLTLLEKKSKMLSAILIMNNVVNLSASALVTTLTARIWPGFVAVATGILTLVILIFGEINPKTIATIHNEALSLHFSGVVSVTMKVLTPVIFIVDKLSRLFLKILRVDPEKAKSVLTENEIRTILDASHEEGVIETGEREMI